MNIKDILNIIMNPKHTNSTKIEEITETREDEIKLIKNAKLNKMNNMNVVYVLGKVSNDGTIIETIYNPEIDDTYLVLKKDGEYDFPEYYQDGNLIYRPLMDNVIHRGITQLPTSLTDEEIESNSLLEDIKNFINKYVELEEEKIEIASRYVLMTWFYDRFQRIPYIRILGPFGTGKSRFLYIMAGITYHSSILGVGITEANIFRMLEKYPGTLILDEMDRRSTRKENFITQILNSGYDRDSVVTRTNPFKGYIQEHFSPFGPKIIASRLPFDDDSLESRILNIPSQPLTRKDIPKYIPPYQEWEEILNLRNKLLKFRLENFFNIDPNMEIMGLEDYNPRTEEILLPIIQVMGENTIPEIIKTYADKLIEERNTIRSFSDEGLIAQSLIDLSQIGRPLFVKEVADHANNISGNKYLISPRRAGAILQGFSVSKRRTAKGVLVECSESDIDLIRKEYGIYDEDTKHERVIKAIP
jgi:hypothetical protein